MLRCFFLAFTFGSGSLGSVITWPFFGSLSPFIFHNVSHSFLGTNLSFFTCSCENNLDSLLFPAPSTPQTHIFLLFYLSITIFIRIWICYAQIRTLTTMETRKRNHRLSEEIIRVKLAISRNSGILGILENFENLFGLLWNISVQVPDAKRS